MAEFVVKVRVGGKIEQVQVMADSMDQAKRVASQQGRVMSVHRKLGFGAVLQSGMKTADRIIFLRRLATMIRSRVGTSEALKTMRVAFKGRVSRVSGDLERYVASGADFAKALDTMPKDFPSTTVALIKAGMRGGNIYKALNDAAAFEGEMDRIRRSSGKQMVSAAVSFLIGMLVIIGCSEFLGPYILSIDLLAEASKTPTTQFTFAAANVMGKMTIVIFLAFMFLVVLKYVIRPLSPIFADRIILRIPIYRDLVMAQNTYAVFYGLGLLTRSGVRMADALRLSYDSAPKGETKADLARALEALQKGKPWPQAMRNLHPTDIAALSTSQDREQVADSVEAIADMYRETYAQRIAQVVPTMQMLSAFFMSVGAAIMFGMIVLPILQMSDSIM